MVSGCRISFENGIRSYHTFPAELLTVIGLRKVKLAGPIHELRGDIFLVQSLMSR